MVYQQRGSAQGQSGDDDVLAALLPAFFSAALPPRQLRKLPTRLDQRWQG